MFPFYSSYRLPSLTSELLLIPFCALVLFWRVWPLICVSPLGVFHCCYRPISYRRLDYGVVRDQTKYTVIESVQRHYNTLPSPAHCCSRMSSEYKSIYTSLLFHTIVTMKNRRLYDDSEQDQRRLALSMVHCHAYFPITISIRKFFAMTTSHKNYEENKEHLVYCY